MPARSFGLLLLCFFLSGLAALIYQTAWTRLFAFVFGTSELAVASVLAAYMGGLALGAAVVGRLVPRVRRPILVYGLLELAIGATALAVPVGISLATRLYVAVFGGREAPADEGGLVTALFYLACSFAILLVPTSLMGATLPLLARHAVRSDDEIGSRIGRLYATNTAGAVAGTVLTGFVLLPALGLGATVWIAVATNLAVFGAAAALARAAVPVGSEKAVANEEPRNPHRWVLPLIAASGAVSFTYEVLWTRLLGHVLGGSVYAFATMLATFLTGIALGSWLASGRLSASRRSATLGFGAVQVGTGVLSLVAYLAIDATPGWVERLSPTGGLQLLLDAAIAAAILLPGTLCIGATFPLTVRILARGQRDAGRASARVYAWNTVGAIAGAVGAGFLLIPAVGFAWTLSGAVAANACLAILAGLRAAPRPRALLAAALLLPAVLLVLRPGPPWQVLRMGTIANRVKQTDIVYYGVGRSATVLLLKAVDGWQLSSNGLAEAQINRPGVRVGRFVMVRWMSNLPAWGRPDARSIFVVGLGGALVVEAVPPSFERIDVAELEAEMVEANRRIASERREDPLSDPRLSIIVNDARSALLLTQERYDAVVSQPSHPWTAGASHLYTREFFELVREHLTEDGVFVQWMGNGFIDESLFRSLVATLCEVFPHVRIYRPSPGGLLFTASMQRFAPEEEVHRSLARAPELAAELGVHGGADVAAYLLLDEAGTRALARDATVSTDDRNLLQMESPGIVRADTRFDPDPVAGPFDPLAVPEIPWDRAYLVRRLLAAGQPERARRIADAATRPAEGHTCRGLLARAAGDLAAAERHWAKALTLDPGSREARGALFGMLGGPAADEAALARRLGGPLTPVEQQILEGSRRERAQDIAGLRELDEALAAVAPADPLFLAAARLRVAWRLADRSPARGREALRILDVLLPLGGSAGDLVLRAEAAGRAGYPAGVSSSLGELLRKLGPRDGHEVTLRRALALLADLPDEVVPPEWRRRLATRIRARLP